MISQDMSGPVMKQENANDDYEALDPLDSGNSVYIGGGSDFEGELKKVNVEFPRRCVAKRKLKRKLNQKSSARKSTDNRAHINRDNWNEESTAALIAQVEKYPVIWDVHMTGFRIKTLRDSAWMKVRNDGNLTHIDDAECRRKWQHLCNFNNKLAYIQSTASAKKTPNWIHWTAMEFIRKRKASYKANLPNLEADDKVGHTERPRQSKFVDKRAHINRENWNEELTATLIAQVKKHPVIWDINSAGFRIHSKRASAWKKVRSDGCLMHIDDAECRRKWQHLCNNNNKLANAELVGKTPRWVHWTAMKFARKDKASYKKSTQSDLESDDSDSLPQDDGSTNSEAKRTQRPMSPTATDRVLEKLDALIETIGEGQSNPNLAATKEWVEVLNRMSPMYAARAKSKIKAMLSEYWQLSVAAEEEAAEKQYRSELAKTSICIALDFVHCGVTQSVFVLGNNLEKLDLSRHTEVVVFKANGELLTDPSAIKNVKIAVGMRQQLASVPDLEQPTFSFMSL